MGGGWERADLCLGRARVRVVAVGPLSLARDLLECLGDVAALEERADRAVLGLGVGEGLGGTARVGEVE